MPLGEISELNDFISNFPVSSGELWDAHGMIDTTADSSQGGDFIANIFDGVIDRADLNIPGVVKAAEKSMQQVIVIPCAFLPY